MLAAEPLMNVCIRTDFPKHLLFDNMNDNKYPTVPCSTVGSKSDCRSRGCEFYHGPVPSFLELDHEIFSMVILLLPLIQDGLLSVTRESQACPGKRWG